MQKHERKKKPNTYQAAKIFIFFVQYENEWKDIKTWFTLNLNLIGTNKTLISDKFKHNDNGFKYFIGYKDDNIVQLMCIILPQMSGYITYFENWGKKYVLYDERW